ncbi:putative ATPase containing protein [uncultured Caudovirales phage]|uniref:Putative ATPase containing protein n=1 Tax=uncultured Caudovirales phage TaxID=2100421 RepID=A0A2H4J8K7_9CAUD|nr:putative ATPase containing protein [uncultured Caudovirales phage]
MYVVKLISAHCENFKGFKSFDMQFGDRITHIKGANGLGKSSIAELLMWVLHGVGNDLTSNPKVRREVDKIPVADVPVVGEITMIVNGKEIVARKVQKRTVKKDGSYSDDNTYSINGVEKNLKDFIAYFDFSFDDLLMCMNIGAFMAKKPKEMREFLFKLPQDISIKDIVNKYPEFAELVPLLEKYDIDEISSMNKASITKLNKEIAGYPGRIDEVNRQVVEDIDTAELELQKNELQRQIADIEKQEEDSLAQAKLHDSRSKDILDLQFKRSEIERVANGKLVEQKKEIQKRIDDAELQFRQAMNDSSMAEMDKQRVLGAIKRKKEQKASLLQEYTNVSQNVFPSYSPLPELNSDMLVCPTCGQELPESVKAQKEAEYEENSRKHRQLYESDKKDWEKHKLDILASISEKGRTLKAEIERMEGTEFAEIEDRIKLANEQKVVANGAKNKALEEMNTLPVRVDLSDNQEYEAICLEISKKEEALKAINTGADYRATLRNQKADIQVELDSVKEKVSRTTKNVELEERLSFLRNEQLQKEQSKADCEKILDLLDQLDQKKNELLVDSINSFFGGRVTWDLFAFAKNGGYKKDYCVPRIDGFEIHDNTANHGRKIEAMMIIALTIQKIVGIQCPVILDDGESLDPWRLPVCDSQLIVMSRKDNKALIVEVA